MGTVSTTDRYDDETVETLSPNFSRTLVIGVVYGLVAWFHVVLCAAYAIAGFVPGGVLSSVYGTTPTVWGITYCVTGGVMLVVAIGLVNARPWAWRVAPWFVLPSLIAHLVFIVVLPVWGVVGIACDLLAIGVVLVERPRLGMSDPVIARVRALRMRREPVSLLRNGPST